MTPSLVTQSAYQEGFARGLIKKALLEGLWGGPGRAELEALGKRLFEQQVSPGTGMVKRFVSSVLPAYGQREQVSHALMSKPMTDPAVRDLLHQIGQAAHNKMRFYGTQLPLAATGAAGVGAGLTAGRLAGEKARERYDTQAVGDMPIWDRLRYLVLPHTLNLNPRNPNGL